MDIKTEKEIYHFCQYFNNKSDDKGTAIFVAHLYATDQLKYLSFLYDEPIEVTRNEELAYLIAIEKILEKFSIKFDGFIRSFNSNAKREIYPDVINNSRELIKALDACIKGILSLDNSFSLIILEQTVAAFVKKANGLIDLLMNQNAGITTNITSLEDLLLKVRRLSLNAPMGAYFCYRG